ncbi:DNA polymerase III subunit gamma and tau [Microbacterium sp. AR7-10]|uniref:DNA polymerase III subunit gamma and tau n=1 Tax=Microbacterium sp. AR7-10 TaxID=1891970 RepID=UPI0008FC4F22|nr:DNA polymerase III subunit gamma and tau [Microbacterium sp. AR7-10]OIU86778.1 DNA polymerase III, subunit gamma and tau [Microbacterium sp. AR7-10]
MTTALYRRYRPETFGEMIGQSQVTDPLMTALRGDRVGHAYLFSGPRGCGKTTSARILARCLNCTEGPTDTPCGVCPSCVELSRAGGGSLDVVEIDAASHNGVDDARDLRERATFAPSRDRFKIFILDEAHMVTPQGFNALLKLVEEPPAHVKFIFATTEPEKVLGTIRSRTHHYPFRLVPPAAMLEYVEKLCGEEGVQVEQGVLALVVRAGGGSPRDTLSLLDQLIAGSDEGNVTYERAVALLGYTHAALLDEIVDALAAGDAAAAFPAVDRVVQTGQDPRRFVDDLLERLRDLIVIEAVGDGASAVLRGIPADEMERMQAQAAGFGAARLSRTADLVSQALDDMSGATSPRLHLELMVARVLAGSPRDAAAPAPAPAAATPAPAATASPAAAAAHAPARAASPAGSSSAAGDAAAAAPPAPADAPAVSPVIVENLTASGPVAATMKGAVPSADAPSADDSAAVSPLARAVEAPAPDTAASTAESASADAQEAAASTPADAGAVAPASSGPVTFERIAAAWPAVLARLESISRTSWLVVTGIQPLAFDAASGVLTLGFSSPSDVPRFKGTTPGKSTSDHLRTAIEQELGVTVKYRPAPLPPGGGGAAAPAGPAPTGSGPGAASTDPAPTGSSPTGSRPGATAAHAAAAGDDAPAAGWANPMSGPQDLRDAGGGAAAKPRAGSGGAASGGTRSAAAAVTDWAVAPIPSSAPVPVPAPVPSPAPDPFSAPDHAAPLVAAPAVPVAASPAAQPQFPVDDEPAEVEAAASASAPPHDGDIDAPPPPDDYPPYDDEPPYDPEYDEPRRQGGGPVEAAPARDSVATPPQASARPSLREVPQPPSRPQAPDGVERRGEAVIRQVLGAKFLREEPYQPPSRFN